MDIKLLLHSHILYNKTGASLGGDLFFGSQGFKGMSNFITQFTWLNPPMFTAFSDAFRFF